MPARTMAIRSVSGKATTLVVDTIGFNDITWLDHAGLP